MQTNRRLDTHPETEVPDRSLASGLATRIILIVCVLLVAGGSGAVFLALSKQQTAPVKTSAVQPVLTVTVEKAEMRSIHKEVRVTGSVWAREPLSIASEVNGLRIEEVLADEGQQVRKGQPLVVLNSAVLRAELQRERAILASAQAALQKSYQPNRPEDINGLKAAVAQAKAAAAQQRALRVQAEANLLNARSNAVRYVELWKQGATSAQEAETRETASRVAEAELKNAEERIRASEFVLRQAEERLALAEAGGRKEDVQIARAEVQRAQANVQRLEGLIAQTIIRAPSDGLLTRREAFIGDTSSAGKAMFFMIRANELELRALVPEKDLALLSKNQEVTITSPGLAEKTVTGRIRYIGDQVDPDTRLCVVKIALPKECGLKPGMFAEGRVGLQNYSALTVSSRSVISRDDHYLVFSFKQADDQAGTEKPVGTVQLRFVQIGAQSGDLTEIKSGIKQGDLVISNGAAFLKDGDIVAIGH